MNVTAGAKTDPGQRPNNEDQYAVVDTRRRQMRADGVLIVADGMGGRSFGEQAAQTAVETVQDTLAEMLDSRLDGEVIIPDVLISALRKANARVYEMAGTAEDRKGMGTTCVAAVVEGDRLFLAHAGDSRAYLLREGGLRQLTDDHSYVAEQVRAGAISEEGARRSRFRNIITRAVGIEPTLEADVAAHEAKPGDILLLCTDGLSNAVAEDEIARLLTQNSAPQAAAERLVQAANRNGGKDNITAVVARFGVGTRTQRMQVTDFVRPGAPEGAGQAEEGQAEAAASLPTANVLPGPPRRVRRSPILPLLAALLAALLIALGAGASAWLGRLLLRDGYHFQTAPPFAVKPVPPPPPAPPDPAHVAYDSPAVFYFAPVRGDLLTLGAGDGAVTVATLAGSVLKLAPDSGQVRYKFTLPPVHLQAPAPPGAIGASGTTLHTASDPQGNLYVSDALTKTITKYRANGVALGLVAHLSLKNPQAIAAAPDGTIYVVDAERLKVLRAHPSLNPLPPIPKPPAPKPAAPVLAAPPPPAAPVASSGYRHYGYRHFGFRRGYGRTR